VNHSDASVFERYGGIGLQTGGGKTGFTDEKGYLHGETTGMGSANELFGIGTRGILKPGPE